MLSLPEHERLLLADNSSRLSLLRFQYYEMHVTLNAALFGSPMEIRKYHGTNNRSAIHWGGVIDYNGSNSTIFNVMKLCMNSGTLHEHFLSSPSCKRNDPPNDLAP